MNWLTPVGFRKKHGIVYEQIQSQTWTWEDGSGIKIIMHTEMNDEWVIQIYPIEDGVHSVSQEK